MNAFAHCMVLYNAPAGLSTKNVGRTKNLQDTAKKLQKGVDKPKAAGYNGCHEGNGVFELLGSKALFPFHAQIKYQEGNGVFHVVST